MNWKEIALAASVSLAVASLFKYGFLYLIARIERQTLLQALKKTLKEDMSGMIIDRIHIAVERTLTHLIYSDKTIKIVDRAGNPVGFIRKSTETNSAHTGSERQEDSL
ncbi:hypothetical protein [Paenibacillus sp. NPDC058071]|uniref:hypothetical protein n=1 Tax=Paenibacillus sp. NPDC058071 TaxID=3346326 RepID=UPI0036D75BB5